MSSEQVANKRESKNRMQLTQSLWAFSINLIGLLVNGSKRMILFCSQAAPSIDPSGLNSKLKIPPDGPSFRYSFPLRIG